MLTTSLWIGGLAVFVTALYGLHRLAMQLEERGLIYYLKEKRPSGGGSMFSPFQEMIQPEIRQLMEVKDEVRYKREDAGDPLVPLNPSENPPEREDNRGVR